MSSTLYVPVTKVDEIKPHTNSDNLQITCIKGWQVVVRKNTFKQDDVVVYFPPDSILPLSLSDKLGVTNYLSKGRVRSVKLRNEFSHGFVAPISDFPDITNYTIDDNVADKLGVTKWEPPVKYDTGDAEIDHHLFHRYTDIENLRNFPDMFCDDELITVTEKIHGRNSRIGLIDDVWMAGSHNLRKKQPIEGAESVNYHWLPYVDENVRNMIIKIKNDKKASAVIMFCEIYGCNQDLKYGHTNGKNSYIIFDISVDGRYLSYDEFINYTNDFKINRVPLMFIGKYKELKLIGLDKLAEGKTNICNADNIREGFVAKPAIERWNEKIGRVILKYLSNSYLTRKDGTEEH